ncbi:hypothetical protein [Leptospira bandrabouensis]|uniref:hypothetical protein n=1 Tax=Leptospira bandrabouensis TaxID=2484903 RepID=UPI001EEB2667|nr:hypothetical protein [Leptospira bandrabouensis]MCG6145849.1 hypothetical protein [Leptospira bandrabouensis]MCG6165436.1 hypothetical protein [Leptospira bandrabouensis]
MLENPVTNKEEIDPIESKFGETSTGGLYRGCVLFDWDLHYANIVAVLLERLVGCYSFLHVSCGKGELNQKFFSVRQIIVGRNGRS